MQVRIICILILFLSSLSVFSQIDLKLANDYFQFGNYENALKSYEYLYEKDTTNADVIYKLGVCHLILMKDRSKAVPFLEKASTMKGVIDFVWFDLGSAYRYTHQFDKSNEALTKFLSLTRNSTDKELCELML
ncbi:MAG: tetratricopeptide repeat protein, partial [Salinivirgaceae bacterium]|nr:tetratricopeptide repeat protein [Salinivirgaceae bacterium]